MSAPPRRAAGVSGLFLYFVMLIILFAFSMLFLYQGLYLYSEGKAQAAVTPLFFGLFGVIVSLLILRRLRKSIVILKPSAMNVVTVAQCGKCGFKSLRKFERGDYVFKQVEKCPKCSEPTTITSIYLEGIGKKEYPF